MYTNHFKKTVKLSKIFFDGLQCMQRQSMFSFGTIQKCVVSLNWSNRNIVSAKTLNVILCGYNNIILYVTNLLNIVDNYLPPFKMYTISLIMVKKNDELRVI